MILPIDPPKPLSRAKAGKTMEIVDLIGGDRATRRLLEMGLYAGAGIEVISGRGFGPIVLKLAGTRLALGRGLAKKILVREA